METQPDAVDASPADVSTPDPGESLELLELPTQADPDLMNMITASDDSLADIVSIETELRDSD